MAASPHAVMLAADSSVSVSISAPAGSASTSAGRTTIVVRADPRTGRLVRTAVTGASQAKAPAASKPSKEISEIVDLAARTHAVDPLLVHSIIKQESNYNAYAISNKGAEGLMQLMPPTARMLGVANSFDPRENIEAGVKYLKYLQGVFKDDRLALAAYNAGPGNVEKYKQVPPIKETQNYVDQVSRRYENAKRAQAIVVRPAVDAPLPEPVNLEKHPKLEQFVDEHGRLSLRTIE